MAKKKIGSSVLNKAFVDNHENVSEDLAAELIVKAEQKIREIKEERSADEKLTAARNIVKELNSGYTSAIKYEESKISFLLEKIGEIQDGSVNPNASV